MAIRDELIEELLAGKDPQRVFSQDGLLDELKKALAERILNAEMDQHLAAERAEADESEGRNHRNGHSRKTVLTGSGKLDLQVPRDRQASFEPQLIAKYRRRFPDFDEKIVSLYARGMTVRDIQAHLRELYGIDVSPDLVSVVTDAVLEQVAEWQNRPLDPLYALVFFDALRVKIRDEGTVRNKAVYLALGVRPDGTKDVLGLWIEQTEGAKFWLRVMNELRNRGVADMLIAVVDGLKGFPEAISAVFPEAQIQTCIVHLIRHSLAFASWKERRDVAAALKPVYQAANADLAREQLEAADTHDPYWNAAQAEMNKTGFMHNYMRMYWGKRVLEWGRTPEEAYETLLYLNNKLFLCGRDPNGWANVGWIFGLHDRPWGPERPIFGKVRYMNAAGLERKFDMRAYVDKVATL